MVAVLFNVAVSMWLVVKCGVFIVIGQQKK